MLKLRNMIESDIEDNVRWFTKEIEWMNWDGPWEEYEINEEFEREDWTRVYNAVKNLPLEERGRLEVELDGKHIGWVSSYYDLEYSDNNANIVAIGIDLPDESVRGKGIGTLALKEYMDFLYELGHDRVLIQTWSGNKRMLRVIEKLGFKEYIRIEKLRTVNGKKYDALTFIKELGE